MKVGIIESKKRNLAPVIEPNTFIGGIAAEINTAAALASKLNISESDISYFVEDGVNIEARIEVNYSIPDYAFDGLKIKYYIENEPKVISIGDFAFIRTILERAIFLGDISVSTQAFTTTGIIELPNTTSIGFASFFRTTAYYINIESCINIGASEDFNQVFDNIIASSYICAHPNKATSNGGNEEGDLAYSRSQGVAIAYKSNTIKPSTITDLTIPVKYATAVSLNFTPPESNNAILFYDIYVNGVWNNSNTNKFDFNAVDLKPDNTYKIRIVAVDEFFNKSELSNEVTVTTNLTEPYPISNIICYHKMENNVLGSFRSNKGTPTNISYEPGLVGQRAVFNGSSSKVVVPNSNYLSFGNTPFSVVFVVEFNTQPNGKIQALLVKDRNNPNREFIIDYFNTGFRVLLWDASNNANIRAQTTTPITVGQTYVVGFTYNGGLLATGIKWFVEGVEVTTDKMEDASFAGVETRVGYLEIGNWSILSGRTLNGTLEEPVFFNTELTAQQMANIAAKFNSGQHLI